MPGLDLYRCAVGGRKQGKRKTKLELGQIKSNSYSLSSLLSYSMGIVQTSQGLKTDVSKDIKSYI